MARHLVSFASFFCQIPAPLALKPVEIDPPRRNDRDDVVQVEPGGVPHVAPDFWTARIGRRRSLPSGAILCRQFGIPLAPADQGEGVGSSHRQQAACKPWHRP